jgi:hypothetical protein
MIRVVPGNPHRLRFSLLEVSLCTAHMAIESYENTPGNTREKTRSGRRDPVPVAGGPGCEPGG